MLIRNRQQESQPQEGGGFSIINGNQVWLPGGPLRTGLGYGVSNAGLYDSWPSGSVLTVPITTPITISLRQGYSLVATVIVDSTNTQQNDTVVSVGKLNTTLYEWVLLRVNTWAHWNEGFSVRAEANAIQTTAMTGLVSRGRVRTAIATVNADGDSFQCYCDGVLKTATGAQGFANSVLTAFTVGGYTRSVTPYAGQLFGGLLMAALIPRVLTIDEIVSIGANPWQILARSIPLQTYQPADSGILVPPVLSNPGFTNITSTGGTPVITTEY